MEDASPRTEFVCFGRPVRDAVGLIVNSLTVTVAAVTLGLAAAALVDGTEVTLVLVMTPKKLSESIRIHYQEVCGRDHRGLPHQGLVVHTHISDPPLLHHDPDAVLHLQSLCKSKQ